MSRQAITTQFYGPSIHRGARIVARCQAGTISVAWDHAVDIDTNHAYAAQALARKLEWDVDELAGPFWDFQEHGIFIFLKKNLT